ncbi:hypothetical protein KAR91_47125 [Candidatus Pacearchaeota archaeon]|nr:hypothetical protein [Candidatus Pacearchaeota archaeon]
MFNKTAPFFAFNLFIVSSMFGLDGDICDPKIKVNEMGYQEDRIYTLRYDSSIGVSIPRNKIIKNGWKVYCALYDKNTFLNRWRYLGTIKKIEEEQYKTLLRMYTARVDHTAKEYGIPSKEVTDARNNLYTIIGNYQSGKIWQADSDKNNRYIRDVIAIFRNYQDASNYLLEKYKCRSKEE